MGRTVMCMNIKTKEIKKTSVEHPDVSIVIRCKNEADHINKCICALQSQNVDFSYEILVIDSGSSDETVKKSLKFDVSIYLIKPEDFNFGSSINLGIELARGKYCVFVSAHAIPKNSEWLKELVHPLMLDESLAATYSRQLFYDDTFFIEKRALKECFGQNIRIQKLSNCERDVRKIRKEITFSNASSCINKEVAVKIPFKIISASEDREWAYRVLKKGYKIMYNSNSEIYHAHNESKDKYYNRILINSEAIYEILGLEINIFHVIPLFFLQIYKDLMFCIKNKIRVTRSVLCTSIVYRYYYVKAHYLGTRGRKK